MKYLASVFKCLCVCVGGCPVPPNKGDYKTESNKWRIYCFIFQTNCRKIGGVKISLDIKKKTLGAVKTKLIILNVNNKMKVFVIVNLILNIEDSLDYPERKLVWKADNDSDVNTG